MNSIEINDPREFKDSVDPNPQVIGNFWGHNARLGQQALYAADELFPNKEISSETFHYLMVDIDYFRLQFQYEIQEALSLQEIKEKLIHALKTIHDHIPTRRLGYISGIISSDGKEYISRNSEQLYWDSCSLGYRMHYPILSPVDVFTSSVYEKIGGNTIPNSEFIQFWRDVFTSGYITDVFFAPRWNESEGAKDEYETALKLGLQTHMLNRI